MTGKNITSDSSSRIQEIVDVALQLMRRKSYRDMTIQDLSDQMGWSKAALYYYVRTKEELLYLIFDKTMDMLYGRIAPIVAQNQGSLEKLRMVIYTYIEVMMERPDGFSVFFMEKHNLTEEHRSAITERERALAACLRNMYEQGVEEGVFRPFQSTVMVMGLLGMLSWMTRWYDPDGPIPSSAVAEQYFQVLSAGLLRSPAEMESRRNSE